MIVSSWLLTFPSAVLDTSFEKPTCVLTQLSRLGLLQFVDFVLFSSPPVDLLPLIEVDKCGLYTNRVCPEIAHVFLVLIDYPVIKKKKKKAKYPYAKNM